MSSAANGVQRTISRVDVEEGGVADEAERERDRSGAGGRERERGERERESQPSHNLTAVKDRQPFHPDSTLDLTLDFTTLFPYFTFAVADQS